MTTTPLIRKAFQLNYNIQFKIFHYPQPFYWDTSLQKFVQKDKTIKTLYRWLFANCIILPWVLLNCVVVVTAHLKSYYTTLNFLQLFTIIVQGLIVLPILVTSNHFFVHSSTWVAFLNSLFAFSDRFAKESPVKALQIIHNQLQDLLNSPKDIKYSKKSSFLYTPNQKLDIFGIFINNGLIMFTFFNFALPPFVFILRLDSPYHFFRIVFPLQWHSIFLARIIIQLTRGFITCWAISEGVNIIRTFVLYTLVAFRIFLEIITNLRKVSVTSRALVKYQSVSILFTMMNENTMSLIMPVYLFLLYIILILCNAITILGVEVLPLHFYISVPFAGIFGLSQLIFMWYVALLLAQESQSLKIEWVRSVAEFGNTKWFAVNRLALKKRVKSMRPICVTYGSFGAMTKNTRTCYMYSLLNDSAQLILTFRTYGGVLK